MMQRDSNESKDGALESFSEHLRIPRTRRKPSSKNWNHSPRSILQLVLSISSYDLGLSSSIQPLSTPSSHTLSAWSEEFVFWIQVLLYSNCRRAILPLESTASYMSHPSLRVGIGTYAGSASTDRFAEWRARKNNGVFEPETRLVLLIMPFFIVPIGLLMYSLPFRRIPNSEVWIRRCPPTTLGCAVQWFWIHSFWHGICTFNYFDLLYLLLLPLLIY